MTDFHNTGYNSTRHGAPNRGNTRMDTTIKVTVTSVYGIPRYYPANALAETMAKSLGQKTLTENQLKAYKDAGFTVEMAALQPPDFLL